MPFVDPLTGMLDPSLPLTVHEFAEWGDPNNTSCYIICNNIELYDNYVYIYIYIL